MLWFYFPMLKKYLKDFKSQYAWTYNQFNVYD